MAYTTYADVLAATGTALPQATVETLIAMADREIDAYLKLYNATGSGTDPAVMSASLNLSICNVLTRYRMDGTKEVQTLEFTDKTPVDTAIDSYKKSAYQALKNYVKTTTTASGFFVGEVVGQ